MTSPEIITRLEALEINYQQLSTTVAELANIMRYQMLQSESDRRQAEIDRRQAETDRRQAETDRNTFINAISKNSEDIERLTERFNQFLENAAIDRNTFIDAISENSEDIERLTERFEQFLENAAQDRQQAAIDRQQAAIDRQQQAELNQQFQSEIRRIWEYLFTQSGNGHNPIS